MKADKYPKALPKVQHSLHRFNGAQCCSICGAKLKPGKRVWKQETQVSIFRGDDEVKFFCFPECKKGGPQ